MPTKTVNLKQVLQTDWSLNQVFQLLHCVTLSGGKFLSGPQHSSKIYKSQEDTLTIFTHFEIQATGVFFSVFMAIDHMRNNNIWPYIVF